MSYNLFLDDIRFPYIDPKNRSYYDKHDTPEDIEMGISLFEFMSAYEYTNFEPFKTEEWVIVRNYKEFCEYIEKHGIPEFVAFDHDLADVHYGADQAGVIDYDNFEEKTGYDCAKWLGEYCMDNNEKYPEFYIHSMSQVGKENIFYFIKNHKKHVEGDNSEINPFDKI